jgi:hypothetical protein
MPDLSPKSALRILFAAVVLSSNLPAPAQRETREDPLPDGKAVLQSVRRQMEGQGLDASGELQIRNADGEIERTMRIRFTLDWGAEPPSAVFDLADAFGSPVARATIRRPAGKPAETTYESGDPLRPGPVPNPFDAVAGTDFTWADLTLDFLWWPGGRTCYNEMKLGRLCHVVVVPAPETGAGGPAAMKLWIDAEARALLQAEALDARGRGLRRLSVRSLKKTEEGDWLVKDFDMIHHATGRRTTLTFETLAARPAAVRPPGSRAP